MQPQVVEGDVGEPVVGDVREPRQSGLLVDQPHVDLLPHLLREIDHHRTQGRAVVAGDLEEDAVAGGAHQLHPRVFQRPARHPEGGEGLRDGEGGRGQLAGGLEVQRVAAAQPAAPLEAGGPGGGVGAAHRGIPERLPHRGPPVQRAILEVEQDGGAITRASG